MSESALQGLKVLDLSRVLAGPWAAMTLGDLGAEVIKVEAPDGDDTRGLGPPFLHGMSAYFACANRNKRSIVLDLAASDSRPIIEALLRWADVLIENFRGDSAAALRVDYPRAAELNPRLIYCSISGYGRTGPDRLRPGYDFVVQAEGGLMAITGAADGPPHKVGVAVADLFAGQNASTAILAALWQRERSGRGQQIDIALFDSQLQMLANVGSNYLFSGEVPPRQGNAHASIVPYQVFDSADHRFVVAVASESLWRRFCRASGLETLADDCRFARNADRVMHRSSLIPLLHQRFSTAPAAHWLQRLSAAGVPCAAINSVATALDSPLAQARGMRVEVDSVPLVGSPLKLSDSPVQYRRAPPALDADRASILAELGLPA